MEKHENSSVEKHEYHQGEVYVRGLCNLTHNRITGNSLYIIHKSLKGLSGNTHGSSLRIYVERHSFFTYPDISIFCDDVVTRDNGEMNATNPSVLIEVLSSVTRCYDKGFKFELYQGIETLKEYITIDSEKINIEIFSINDNGEWESKQYQGIGQSFFIKTIQLEIALKDIYEDTKLK